MVFLFLTFSTEAGFEVFEIYKESRINQNTIDDYALRLFEVF